MCESDNKCFPIRDGVIDYGKDYEFLVAAYYAVKFALDDSVIDFLLSTNNKNFGDFDDVVVELELPNQVKRVYALQLKHNSRSRSISFGSMTGSSGNFSLKRYSNDFLRIKVNNPNNFDDFRFVLYTNSFLPALVQRCGKEEIRVDEMLMPNSQITVTKSIEAMTKNDAMCLFDTSSDGESSMFKFQGGEIDPEFLEKFALFTNQMHARDVETKLREVLMDLCGDHNVVTNLLMYFKYWCRGDYGFYKLSKYDVRVKLAELILNPYILDFPPGMKGNAKAKLFEDAVKCFDITVIENLNVGIISDAAVEDSDLLTRFGLLPNQSLLKSWYLNLVPLAVRCNDTSNDTVRKAMELCNYGGKRKKFLLNSSNHGLSKDWKVFNALGDVPKDLYDRIAENFQIHLQDRHIVSIKDLLALDCSLDITATELLRMVDDPPLVGELKSRLPEYYVSRTVHKVLLKVDVVHCDGIFVIEGSDIATLRKHIKSETVVHIDEYLISTGAPVLRLSSHYLEGPSSHYLEQGNLPKKLIIFCDEQAKLDQLISGSSENVIHYLRFIDQSRLEWIWSKGKVNELVPYRINENEHSVSDNEIFSHFTNNLNILCADPGMGKSVMLDFLKVNTPGSYWSIKIDLNEHFQLFENDVDTDPFTYFSAVTNDFDKKVAQSFARAGRVVVLWDGFDELSEDAAQAVVEAVRKFQKHGFRQLIACRFYNSVMLQDAFDTFALTLTHFRDADLKNYVNQKLKDKCDPEEFEMVLEKILENIAMFGFDAGVPLQAYMLTEIFCENPGEFLQGKIVTVTNIYRSFIESKFDRYFKKEKAANTNPKHRKTFKMLRLKLYEIAALQACLDRIDFNELKLDCTELLEDFKSEDDPVGLIVRVLVVNSIGMAVFAHRTYAEFLAASWFSRNLQHIRMLFKEKLNGVRLMFDVILAINSGAHLAVLYKNPQLLRKCEDFTCKDAGGRSPLHIAASWGTTRQLIKPSMPGYFISHTATEEDSKHLEILECLLEHNDPFAVDSIHQWDSINYADKSLSLSSLEVILRKFDCDINKLTHCDELTLCYYSIKFNYETMFSKIGTVPNVTFVDGTNLLFLAVENNALRFMPKLIKIYDVNARDSNGGTTLLMAVQRGYHEMVLVLLENGARMDAAKVPAEWFGDEGYTLLHVAVYYGHAEVCEILLKLENVDIDARAGNGWTPIMLAAQEGRLDVVKLLIGKGAKLDSNDEGYTPLHQGASNGHAEVCEILLGLENVDIDARTQNGVTPLMVAAERGQLDVIELLMGKGAKLNGNNQGYTPLHQAAAHGHAEVCGILLKLENVDIDARTQNGSTPLTVAAERGHSDVIELLIGKGAKLDGNDGGFTPLHQAASYGHAKICEILLKLENVDIDARAGNGCTPIIAAAQKGHLNVVKLLIGKDAKLNGSNEEYTPLHQAASYGHAEVCEILLKLENVDIDARAGNGRTPIILAAQEGRLDVVKLLIGKGAKLNGDDGGFTPLHLAAFNGHTEVCEIFLKLENVDIDARAGNGWTPIILAAQEGHLDVVKLLIGEGAKLDSNGEGYTPLHRAALYGHAEVCEIFLKLGNVDIDARARNGCTPIIAAAQKGHSNVVKLLIGKGAKLYGSNQGHTPLHQAASYGHAEVCEILLKLENVDIDARDGDGRTPIILAAQEGRLDVVKLLIGKGAKLNSDDEGFTPLHLAASYGHAEVCDILLRLENVDIDARAGNGCTPLIAAAQKGHLDVIKLLIGKGAKLNVSDQGYTPLHKAASYGHAVVCEILLKLENVDIDARAENGRTPIILAAQEGRLDVVKLLIGKGAELNGDDEGFTPLHLAASYGHAEVCEILLKLENVDIDARAGNGCTPLIAAAQKGHLDVVKLLIAKGAKLNGSNQGYTPLHQAASYGHAEVCDILLKLENVDIDARAGNGVTPLIAGVQEGHLDVVKLLIGKGAKLEGDDQGFTPLHQAASYGHAEVCEILLKLENVDIDARAGNGWTPIILAAHEGHLDVVKLLIGKGAIVDGDDGGFTPLQRAAFNGHADVCEILLKLENVDIDARTQNGATPLSVAAQEGHFDVVKLLIGKGAKLNGSNQGYTPLHQAASHGYAEVCEILLKLENVDIDARAGNGWTPIILAAQEGHSDVVKLLIGKGATVDCDDGGFTPLHRAAFNGHAEVCEILLKLKNVDIDARAGNGRTPIILSAQKGHLDVIKLLIDKGATLDGDDEGFTPMHQAACYGHAEVCEILLKLKNVYIDARTQNGLTPLKVAAGEGHLDVVKLLVDKGANVDGKDDHDNTSLFAAAARNHVDVVQFLHQNGARIHVVDQDGDTPLHDAAAKGMLDSAKYLIENGAILTFPNSDGKTPLDLAIENGRSEIVELLGSLVLSPN